MPLSHKLASYAVSVDHADLPAGIRREGARAFLNWAGCAIGGADEGTVDRMLRALGPFSGPREATVIGHPERVDIMLAAMLNSTSSSVHAFNDTHFATVAHPTSPVAAALFALSETRPINGRDFITALVLGIELQCRVGNILTTPPAECGIGLSMAGLTGCIGAAVAAGKVMALDEAGMIRAIGIAANQAAGLREAHATMNSHFTPGNAARAGLTAALLAEAGFDAPETMLDGPKGFGASYARSAVVEAATAGLGHGFEMASLAYKPYPCGFVIHPAIDACLELARAETFDAAQIERVELRVHPLAVQLTDRPDPANRRQALVSIQHWAAAALTFAKAGLREGADDIVQSPALRAMRDRIGLIADPRMAREGSVAVLELHDGTRRQAGIADCRGSAGRPMTDTELADKFRDQAGQLLDDGRVGALLRACMAIEEAPEVGRLAALFRPAAT